MLDNVAPGARANIILNPYNWTVAAKSGVKAYTKKLYIYLDDIDESLAPHMEDFERNINYL